MVATRGRFLRLPEATWFWFFCLSSAQMFSVYWWLWGQEKGLFLWALAQKTLTVS